MLQNIKPHTMCRFGGPALTFLLLLLQCTCTRNSLVFVKGVSHRDDFLSPTSRGSSCSACELTVRIIIVTLHPWMLGYNCTVCFQRARGWKTVIYGKVAHSQPLPEGKHASPHLHWNAGAYTTPKIWLQLPHGFQYIIMPGALLSDLLSVVLNKSGVRHQHVRGRW